MEALKFKFEAEKSLAIESHKNEQDQWFKQYEHNQKSVA